MMYQNDQWNVTNQLGMAAAGDGLAKMILSVTPPFTTAVVGKWGSGKTSLMQRAFATLGGDPVSKAVPLGEIQRYSDTYRDALSLPAKQEIRQPELGWDDGLYEAARNSFCVWYSPWQHQNAANPLIPLLLEIKQQVTQKHQGKEQLSDMTRRGALAALTLLERVVDGALMLTGKTENVVFTGTTDAVRKAWNGDGGGLTELSDGQRFHLQFEDAVKTVLQSFVTDATELHPEARLIIFIDDLDNTFATKPPFYVHEPAPGLEPS
ncbi:MAG: KAP family NTPase [Gammaproteobacteria bacterium]|nr:KAP family NTPase [Gammaproteobacteria bacterium]MBU1724123.1 KAP family NTPase [Gammaproteobacteria bacterium]MBU2006047.1 KAP family NTPase [Gammaproteobacteria bacterium]